MVSTCYTRGYQPYLVYLMNKLCSRGAEMRSNGCGEHMG
jgi:hypothetical protein